MMTDKVIMTAKKGRQKVLLSYINKEKPHEKGDFLGLEYLFQTLGERISTLGLSPFEKKREYLEE